MDERSRRSTSAASGSMREVEHESDVIFILGANTTESHPVFGAAIKRAVKRGATLIVCDPRRIELATRAHVNTAPSYAPRPDYRPLTKFEARGLKLEHDVRDLVFTRRPAG